LRLSKKLAVCRAHNLFAGSKQIPHLQTKKYFLPGTRPGKKWIALDLPPAGGKLCETFLTSCKKRPAEPDVFYAQGRSLKNA
jgi:hypothetical protein